MFASLIKLDSWTDSKLDITQMQDVLGVTHKVHTPITDVSFCTTPVFSIQPLESLIIINNKLFSPWVSTMDHAQYMCACTRTHTPTTHTHTYIYTHTYIQPVLILRKFMPQMPQTTSLFQKKLCLGADFNLNILGVTSTFSTITFL
jgi:hypothetical protein